MDLAKVMPDLPEEVARADKNKFPWGEINNHSILAYLHSIAPPPRPDSPLPPPRPKRPGASTPPAASRRCCPKSTFS